MTEPTGGGEVPDGVLLLLREAVRGDLLTDADRLAPAVLQLALEPAGAPADLAPDPVRVRRTARDGSPVARWYLAADASLPADVAELLARDEDPRVVAALAAAEAQRRLVLGDAGGGDG